MTKSSGKQDQDKIKVECEFCGHVEMLEGLAAWSVIIMKTHVCEKCLKKTQLQI